MYIRKIAKNIRKPIYRPRSPISAAYLYSEKTKAKNVEIKKHKKALSVAVAEEKYFLIALLAEVVLDKKLIAQIANVIMLTKQKNINLV